MDWAGNAYVTGWTNSDETTFPVAVGPDLTHNGATDTFIVKLDASGTSIDYAGYIGGSGIDLGFALAVDGAGHAYVTGSTGSDQSTFPVRVGPDLTYNGGGYDAFVAKVDARGRRLDYAGYIGGEAQDEGCSIAVGWAGDAYVTGWTFSSEATFPVAVGPDLTFNGDADAFVAKVHASGAALSYAGYIGGAGSEVGQGIAVDAFSQAYVAGNTSSTEATFPVKIGPDLTFNGVKDGFVAKVQPLGRSSRMPASSAGMATTA